MLEQILDYIHNYFETQIIEDIFVIDEGNIQVDFLQAGQYFMIQGSVFNDGLHQYPAGDLINETFTGTIRAMAVPPAVIAISEEVEQWVGQYGGVVASPYSSESFGGYSYSKSSGGTSATGVGWQDVFRSRLNRWRKIG